MSSNDHGSSHGNEGEPAPTRNHAEAYCLMKYVDTAGNVEVIWNSRNGVTSHSVTSRQGKTSTHTCWRDDMFAPNHVPKSGDRIFRDMTIDDARAIATKQIETLRAKDSASYRDAVEQLGSHDEAVKQIAADIYSDGHQPMLVTVP